MDQKLSKLLEIARQRALDLGAPYAGALTPREAYEVWQQAPKARLIDVRTDAERDWVGKIPGAIAIEWTRYPGQPPRADFLEQLEAQVAKDSLVMFLCRSSGRSHQAAILASASGYAESFNILEGFEGEIDANGQRGTLAGWRKAGLPWKS